MRLFVALDIDKAIRERLRDFRNRMRVVAPEVRWVGTDSYHITLQFLGECKSLDDISVALQSLPCGPVPLHFCGAGFFPDARAPRIFWAGVESDERLQQLAKAVATALAPLGFERDDSPFTPHLTLARSGSGRPRPVPGERPAPGLQRVRDHLATLPTPEFGTMTAHEFYLYESHLSAAGPRYEKRARFALTGGVATSTP